MTDKITPDDLEKDIRLGEGDEWLCFFRLKGSKRRIGIAKIADAEPDSADDDLRTFAITPYFRSDYRGDEYGTIHRNAYDPDEAFCDLYNRRLER